MRKFVTINGRTFEFVTPSREFQYDYSNDYYGINDAYDNPSVHKINVWNDWEKWFYNAGIEHYGIVSHSCHFFSIGAEYVDYDTGEVFFLKITPAHNYIC